MNKTSPSPTAILWLMLGLTLGTAPHFLHQPIWVSLVFLIALAWRCMNIYYGWPLPGKKHLLLRFVQLGIAGIAILALMFSYGTTIGRDAGVAMLTMMLGLKVVEIQSQRDFYVATFLGYFVVITNFFFSQSIPIVLLMFVVVTIMTACLISLNDPKHQLNERSVLKLSSQMLMQAIPVMLLLFVLFPRIAGPLWGLPQDAHTGTTGMDDTMTLGKISNLIQSDEIAFRVKFDGDLPPPSQRYWRGPVLWQTDGTTWKELDRNSQSPITPDIDFSGGEYSYEVTIEPHNDHWLFALDFPNRLPTNVNAHFTSDGQLRSNDAIKQRQQYQLSSQTNFQFNAPNEPLIKEALALPKDKHPQTIQLAQEWFLQDPNPQRYIQRVLQHFNQKSYYYSLTPPLLIGDSIDAFLFETRRGFCEHYAASFTVLMRAAGIPARVVTGYQGGEINPVNDFLVVRQRDAHAWTEVWLEDEGWLRVDPTAAVSSDRIELGIGDIMPAGMRSPFFITNSRQLISLWQNINNNWDAVNNAWNLWVLAYGPELQKNFLSSLGMKNPDWQKMAIWLAISISTVLLILSFTLLYQRKHPDPVVQLYRTFCLKLARFDLQPNTGEGPKDFAHRATSTLPHHKNDINTITQLYIDLHYGKQSAALTDLQTAIKLFQPQKAI
ncbi:transglutaminase [Methylophaga sp. 42_25_T18]|nr:transglutaminase [Methylophaga sp. 42_25_T18]OUR88736.1 transglutaminase [Methylophaga sp. 42_8_T64]